MQAKKDTQTKESNIGIRFLTEQLLDVQVKLFELDNRPEARTAEYEAGELVKQEMTWPCTALKAGALACTPFCVVIVF